MSIVKVFPALEPTPFRNSRTKNEDDRKSTTKNEDDRNSRTKNEDEDDLKDRIAALSSTSSSVDADDPHIDL